MFCAYLSFVFIQVFAFNDPKTEIVPESQFPASEEDCQAHDSDVKERTREVNFAKRVWPRLVEHLTKFKEKPRFAVASFHYMAGERPSDKLVYICWSVFFSCFSFRVTSLISLPFCSLLHMCRCPDRCSVKDRFVTGWSSQALVAALGVSCQIQACNDDELDYAAVLAKVTRI